MYVEYLFVPGHRRRRQESGELWEGGLRALRGFRPGLAWPGLLYWDRHRHNTLLRRSIRVSYMYAFIYIYIYVRITNHVVMASRKQREGGGRSLTIFTVENGGVILKDLLPRRIFLAYPRCTLFLGTFSIHPVLLGAGVLFARNTPAVFE